MSLVTSLHDIFFSDYNSGGGGCGGKGSLRSTATDCLGLSLPASAWRASPMPGYYSHVLKIKILQAILIFYQKVFLFFEIASIFVT